MKIQLFAFDLDGTLTQHKTPLEPAARAALHALRAQAPVVMVGAGDCLRIWRQMDGFPADLIGNYGMQRMDCVGEGVPPRPVRSDCAPVLSRAEANRRAAALRVCFGLTEFAGDSVEFHDSGVLTFALLGTAAKQPDKLAFDPDRARRRVWLPEVVAAFPEYHVFVGGSSSFDLAPKPYCKSMALRDYCAEKQIPMAAVRYFGDDYGPGGNDADVLAAGFPFIRVDDYRAFPQLAHKILSNPDFQN